MVPSAQTLRISDFSFSDFELSDLETALCTIRMFTDLNLVQNFQMKHEVGVQRRPSGTRMCVHACARVCMCVSACVVCAHVHVCASARVMCVHVLCVRACVKARVMCVHVCEYMCMHTCVHVSICM